MAGEFKQNENKGWLYHPDFPDHWERCSLYTLAEWVNGLAFRDIQFSTNGMPVIKIAEIKGGISEQTKFTQQTFDESVHVRPGDLLFSWSGQPETSIDAFWWRGPEGWLNQHVFRVTPAPGIRPPFFYYLLRYLKPNFIGIARNKQTTGLGHVTKGDLENIEAAYPGEPEQRAIAYILGTLDDKIELNRRMGETLEAMARALFKSWFVDFEPVRAKMEGRWRKGESLPGHPAHLYDLFPNRLVDSELGEIPEGWTVEVFEALAVIRGGKQLPTDECMPTGLFPVFGANGVMGFTAQTTHNGFVIAFGRVGAYCGSVHWAYSGAWINNNASSVVPARWPEYVLQVMLEANFEGMRTGSAQPFIPNSSLAQMPIVRPTDEVLDAFCSLAAPVRIREQAIIAESRTLAALRDALLPKLISGELRVKDAEKFIGRD